MLTQPSSALETQVSYKHTMYRFMVLKVSDSSFHCAARLLLTGDDRDLMPFKGTGDGSMRVDIQ